MVMELLVTQWFPMGGLRRWEFFESQVGRWRGEVRSWDVAAGEGVLGGGEDVLVVVTLTMGSSGGCFFWLIDSMFAEGGRSKAALDWDRFGGAQRGVDDGGVECRG